MDSFIFFRELPYNHQKEFKTNILGETFESYVRISTKKQNSKAEE